MILVWTQYGTSLNTETTKTDTRLTSNYAEYAYDKKSKKEPLKYENRKYGVWYKLPVHVRETIVKLSVPSGPHVKK